MTALTLDAAAVVGDLRIEIALSVEPGECVALVGPSGAGKTSVLRIAAGLLSPERGRVELGEETWVDTERDVSLEARRRGCGFVFQDYALFPRMRAWQNVAYGMRGVPRTERKSAALEVLDRFGVSELADAAPPRLSGGERQRVALARALATRPRVLLLDEPLAALDTRSRAHAGRALAQLLGGLEIPTLLVTHDFEHAALFAGRIAVMDRGRVVQLGTPADLAAAPASAFVADFTGATVLGGTASAAGDGLTEVRLEGGGTVLSTDAREGPVAVSVHPWEIALEPPGTNAAGSAQNRLPASVLGVTPLGNRVRVGLMASQPLTAELTAAAARMLRLEAGSRVVATWKATATRLVPR